jgi:hypothetical protein
VFDVDYTAQGSQKGLKVPEGFRVKQYEISLRGGCRNCEAKAG